MDQAFAAIRDFEPQNHIAYMVRSCLVRFNAIFTLNQDLLMERQTREGDEIYHFHVISTPTARARAARS